MNETTLRITAGTIFCNRMTPVKREHPVATPHYVNSPGPGPYSLRSLTQPAPRRRIGIPDQPRQVGLGPKPNPRTPAAAMVPTDAQAAQTQVSAAFDPVLKQITDAFN